MPFTPAHTAIVLPFLKSRWFSATGLIIGSMAPDFEYFFKMSVNSRHSHTVSGIFYFDVPVTFLLAFLFHEVVKTSLIRNLPALFQTRLKHTLALEFIPYLKTNFWIFLLSAFMGAISHVVWDSFTHLNGYFVNELPFIYQDSVVPFDGARYPLWYALQHISTMVGLLAVTIYFFAQKPVDSESRSIKPLYWIGLVAIASTVMAIRFGFSLDDVSLGNVVVSIISSLLLAVTVLGLADLINRSHG